jgi:hypothetical protein
VQAPLEHAAVVAALQEGLGQPWTVTVRSAKPQAPLIAMFSGSLQRAEPKDDSPSGEAEFVWYVGTEDRTWGAFSVPREDFRGAAWEWTPRGRTLVVQIAGLLIAFFPRSDEEDPSGQVE